MPILSRAQNILITLLTATTLFGASPVLAAGNRCESQFAPKPATTWSRVAAGLSAAKAAASRLRAGVIAKVEAANAPVKPVIDPSVYGTMRPDFVHNDKYTTEVDDQSAIKNQCQLGTCHLYSWGSELEQEYKDRTGKDIVVSMRYEAAHYWLERALEELVKPTFEGTGKDRAKTPSKLEVSLGSWPITSRQYILHAGIVPDAVWTPRVDFTMPPYSTRLEEYVENVIAKVRLTRDTKMYQNEKDVITNAGAAEIMAIFENVVGPFPTNFTYEGKSYDPRTFMVEHFPELLDPLVAMMVHPNPQRKTEVDKTEFQTMIATNVDNVEKSLRQVLDEGHNVYLAYQHEDSYVDKETGIMSIAAFNVPEIGSPMPAYMRNYFGKVEGGHAVQIVGYDLDPATGKVVKWKIKNSWGTKVASDGYFHMYDDYFRTFAIGIFFSRKLGIKLPRAETHEPEQLDLPFPKLAPKPPAAGLAVGR